MTDLIILLILVAVLFFGLRATLKKPTISLLNNADTANQACFYLFGKKTEIIGRKFIIWI